MQKPQAFYIHHMLVEVSYCDGATQPNIAGVSYDWYSISFLFRDFQLIFILLLPLKFHKIQEVDSEILSFTN